eukprot:jgi/Tetstr1/457167/TSEL_043817.t1
MGGRRGACVEENAGWERRILGRAAAGGVLGAFTGTWLALSRRQPLLATSFATSTNVALAASLYGVCQETLRVLTCQDGPVNSVFAGGLAGYALGMVQHGRGKGPAVGAAIFATAGGVCHALDARGFGVGSVGESALRAVALVEARPPASTPGDEDGEMPWYERWLPIRKLDPDEYDNHHQQQELKNAYGTGQIGHQEYQARMADLQMDAFMRKQERRGHTKGGSAGKDWVPKEEERALP